MLLDPIQTEYFAQIVIKTNQPLYKALIDPRFYPKLHLNSIKSSENIKGITISGLLNTTNNQIEIWYDGKKISKFKIIDLNENRSLLQIYSSQLSTIKKAVEPGIYIAVQETGLVGSFEIMLKDFDVSQLWFRLIEYENEILLHKIRYEQTILKLRKKDTLEIRKISL